MDISLELKNRIRVLDEVNSITNLLFPPAVASTTVAFKQGTCPAQSTLTADDAYFLQTINSATGLPTNYVPRQLVDIRPFIKTSGNGRVCMAKPAAEQLYLMSEEMEKKDLKLVVVSGYRSYKDQQSLFTINAPVMNKGVYDRVAPAGHSEHQLGTAVDIASEFQSGVNFSKSAECMWIKENAQKYGFLLSYEEGYEDRTGYMYEPWHLRYIGKQNAVVLRQVDYSLAFKPVYYRKNWMNTLLMRLKEHVGENDPSIGG